MNQIKVSIVVNLEDGCVLNIDDLSQAKDDLEDAIRDRIFGEGVFADHVLVDTYTVDSSYIKAY